MNASEVETQTTRIRQNVRLPIKRRDGRDVEARLISFDGLGEAEHILIIFPGEAESRRTVPLVRVHSECLTGDVLGSARCDCGPQFYEAVDRISRTGGAVAYLRQEGRGIGLYNKIDAYALQELGEDTYEANETLGFPADARDYKPAAQMLAAAGITTFALLTNNLDKVRQLRKYGSDIVTVECTKTYLTVDNYAYLLTKARATAHILTIQEDPR